MWDGCAGGRKPGGLHRRVAPAHSERFGGRRDPGGHGCAKGGGLPHRGRWGGLFFSRIHPLQPFSTSVRK